MKKLVTKKISKDDTHKYTFLYREAFKSGALSKRNKSLYNLRQRGPVIATSSSNKKEENPT